jgi:hypothetical protein
MKNNTCFLTGIVLVALVMMLPTRFVSAQNARALFYDPLSGASLMQAHTTSGKTTAETMKAKPDVKPMSQTKNTGVRYWIELDDPGRTGKLRVNADRVFHSGDRIRIHYASNIDGYLYILQKGSSGEESLLFPTTAGTKENLVKADEDLIAPAPGWFRFDEYPGYERLHIFFMPKNGDPATLKDVTDPTVSSPTLKMQVAQYVYKYKGARDLIAEFDNSYFKLNPSETGAPATIEDAKVGKVPTGTTPPAAYVVNTAKSEYAPPVVFEIFLRHD